MRVPKPRVVLETLRGAATAARIGLLTLREVARFGRRRLFDRLLRRAVSRDRRLGEALTDLCESLGPTFIKAGQVLSSRPDLLSAEMIAPLTRLQDRVAPFDPARVPAILERAFGRPSAEVFEQFDRDPIASASVAHVHRARLLDGREVAVKIRRPGIEARVAADLRLARRFAALADRIAALRLLPVRELLEEIAEAIEQQLDFRQEAANNRRFHENFRGFDRVTFPRLIEDLCGDDVLTMEFLEDLEPIASATLSEEDAHKGAIVGLRALYQMVFTDGFIHADLHPGNLFVRRWGEVVMVDVGLVARLEGDDLDQFVDFFFGMVTNKGRDCARVVVDTALGFADDFDREAFERDIVEMVDHHSNLRADDFEVTGFAFQLFDAQRRHGVRGSTAFTMTILSLAVYEGIVKQLHPALDFQKEARGYLIAARFRRPHLPFPFVEPAAKVAPQHRPARADRLVASGDAGALQASGSSKRTSQSSSSIPSPVTVEQPVA